METTERSSGHTAATSSSGFTIPNIKCKGQYEVDFLAVRHRNSVSERSCGGHDVACVSTPRRLVRFRAAAA